MPRALHLLGWNGGVNLMVSMPLVSVLSVRLSISCNLIDNLMAVLLAQINTYLDWFRSYRVVFSLCVVSGELTLMDLWFRVPFGQNAAA